MEMIKSIQIRNLDGTDKIQAVSILRKDLKKLSKDYKLLLVRTQISGNNEELYPNGTTSRMYKIKSFDRLPSYDKITLSAINEKPDGVPVGALTKEESFIILNAYLDANCFKSMDYLGEKRSIQLMLLNQ